MPSVLFITRLHFPCYLSLDPFPSHFPHLSSPTTITTSFVRHNPTAQNPFLSPFHSLPAIIPYCLQFLNHQHQTSSIFLRIQAVATSTSPFLRKLPCITSLYHLSVQATIESLLHYSFLGLHHTFEQPSNSLLTLDSLQQQQTPRLVFLHHRLRFHLANNSHHPSAISLHCNLFILTCVFISTPPTSPYSPFSHLPKPSHHRCCNQASSFNNCRPGITKPSCCAFLSPS